MTERGYSATKDQLRSRHGRIEGQVRGVEGVVEDDHYWIDGLTRTHASAPRPATGART